MKSLALREDQDDLGFGRSPTDAEATIAITARSDYDPHAAAFSAEKGLSPMDEFRNRLNEGCRVTLSIATKDGRRETFDLDESQARKYYDLTHEDRMAYVNRRIFERRLRVAVDAVRRLAEAGLPPTHDNLTPAEEAYLTEFGLIEETLVARAEGGYDKAVKIRESFADGVRSGAQLREDWGDLFSDADSQPLAAFFPNARREYLPVGGPSQEQQTIADVWDALSKAWYAYTHDPIAKRGCHIVRNFVLGRGVTVIARDKKTQAFIDAFVKRERLQAKLRQFVVTLVLHGEIFVRKIAPGDGTMRVRWLHPETIWEIVTDAEDLETIYWYVQKYPTRYINFASQLPAAQYRYIDRTILASEVIHVKLNAFPSDARGRSEIHCTLAWLRRLRDYFDALVAKEKAAAAYQWIYTVDGGPSDIARISAMVNGTPDPPPGSQFVVNSALKVDAVTSKASSAGTGQGSTYAALLNHVANGFGFSKDYFGAGDRNSRANALVANEPSTKTIEFFQDVIGEVTDDIVQAAIDEGRRCNHPLLEGAKDFRFSIVFPTVAKADASTRVTMIARGESMAYISKRRAAQEWAGEVEIDDYDFDAEQALLKEEGVDKPLEVISKDFEQVKKGLPSSGDAAFAPGDVPNPAASGAPSPSSNGKAPSFGANDVPNGRAHSPTSASGAASIQKDERSAAGQREAAVRLLHENGALVILP